MDVAGQGLSKRSLPKFFRSRRNRGLEVIPQTFFAFSIPQDRIFDIF